MAYLKDATKTTTYRMKQSSIDVILEIEKGINVDFMKMKEILSLETAELSGFLSRSRTSGYLLSHKVKGKKHRSYSLTAKGHSLICRDFYIIREYKTKKRAVGNYVSEKTRLTFKMMYLLTPRIHPPYI